MSSYRQKLRQTVVCVVATLVVFGCIGIWAAAAAHPARAVIDRFDSALLTTMKQGEALGFSGRYDKLAANVDEVFDLRRMAREAAGGAWAGLSAQQRSAHIARFRHDLIRSFAHQFDEHDGERFEVTAVSNKAARQREVSTALVARDGERLPIRYRLANNNGQWRIVDVVAPDNSDLSGQRHDYAKGIGRDSDASLRARAARYAADHPV